MDGNLGKSRHLLLEHTYNPESVEDMKDPPGFQESYALLSAGKSVALSSKWALFKDPDGITWLYRKTKRVGISLDNNSVSLLPGAAFYLEDAQASPIFRNIQIKGL
jgi:hypothetical protein